MREDRIVVSPADSTFVEKFPIDDHSEITVKYTHKYKIPELLEGSPYKDAFKGGLFMHSFLGPSDYHRFRAPVRGTVLECRAIMGEVFLGVGIKDGQYYATDETNYQFRQERGLIVFDSPVGLVAVLPIGMAQVSSVNMVAVKGAYLDKGDEFGYFMFGGSDIIVLFQAGSGVEITAAPGIHYNCGMALGEKIG
jgi:phosphatidylserine decarboxylase